MGVELVNDRPRMIRTNPHIPFNDTMSDISVVCVDFGLHERGGTDFKMPKYVGKKDEHPHIVRLMEQLQERAGYTPPPENNYFTLPSEKLYKLSVGDYVVVVGKVAELHGCLNGRNGITIKLSDARVE
jgi:hypothetical protein